MSNVHSVQSTNPKGNQQTKGKRKPKIKKVKGDKKVANNVGEEKNEKRKVKFPCNICTKDHLNHQFPQLEEAQKILAQPSVMLTNPFLQGNFFSQDSSSTSVPRGSQGSPMPNTKNWATNFYMMKVEANLQTVAYN
jgi:hypothetical protein